MSKTQNIDIKNDNAIDDSKLKEIEETIDNILIDYLDMVKTNMDAYAKIVEKMAEFQEKHKEVYSQFTDMMQSPEKMEMITEEMKELDKDIFYNLITLMFRASSLDMKVRKAFYLSIQEKKDLVNDLNEIYKEMELFFTNLYEALKQKMRKELKK
jgi:hypothetical protein